MPGSSSRVHCCSMAANMCGAVDLGLPALTWQAGRQAVRAGEGISTQLGTWGWPLLCLRTRFACNGHVSRRNANHFMLPTHGLPGTFSCVGAPRGATAACCAIGLDWFFYCAGVNPFEGCEPSVPEGEKLDFGSEEFKQYERMGERYMMRCGARHADAGGRCAAASHWHAVRQHASLFCCFS
jgi:hypothetical protein